MEHVSRSRTDRAMISSYDGNVVGKLLAKWLSERSGSEFKCHDSENSISTMLTAVVRKPFFFKTFLRFGDMFVMCENDDGSPAAWAPQINSVASSIYLEGTLSSVFGGRSRSNKARKVLLDLLDEMGLREYAAYKEAKIDSSEAQSILDTADVLSEAYTKLSSSFYLLSLNNPEYFQEISENHR